MADEKVRKVTSSIPANGRMAAEDEVYSTLGALLGTLEVVVTDDALPLAPMQAERLHTALRLCHGLQQQIEALLTLAIDDLGERLRRARCAVRPLIEHAVRGAQPSFTAHGVSLAMPSGDEWGEERVLIDVSRVDRMIRVLTEVVTASIGRHGTLVVATQSDQDKIGLELAGRRAAGAPAQPLSAALLERAARRLFELHDGSCSVDLARPLVRITLPRVEGA